MSRPSELRATASGPLATAAEQVRRVAEICSPVWRCIRPVLAAVSPLGWSVLSMAVIGWWLGWRFGWVELLMIATCALVLFAASTLFALGRATLRVVVDLDPQRVTVGAAGAGQVRVTNLAGRIRLPISLELPIGPTSIRFLLPMLRPGVAHDEIFVVPTDKRGVIPVGPALTVRGDPLGIVRRAVSWGEPIEMFVHPRTVQLEPLGSGLLRDLEGMATSDVSMSDLAFHALREYQPGDDRRHIHWRSSAKLQGRSGPNAGSFLVRQFLDTRRSHIATIVDSKPESYPDRNDFETALSAAASIALQAVRDEQQITVVAGGHTVPDGIGKRVLDVFSRAELGNYGLVDLAFRAERISPDISIAMLITGPNLPFAEIRRAALNFPPEVRVFAMRIDPAAPTGVSGRAPLQLLSLRTLVELSPLMSGVLQ
jgi:uncharacterized protein (DUF58 family)